MWDGLRRKEEEAGINKTSLVTLEEGDDLPRVQNLRLRGMRFGPLQSESWATQLLWRNIKHLSLLEVNWTSLLPKLTEKGCFHAIEALEASVPIPIPSFTKLHTNTKCISQFHAFLENLPPLKTFIGYGFPQETLAVLAAHHSQHLKDLRFRNQLNTGTGYSTGDPAFRASIHSLENLSTQFPSLDSLGLQVDWTTDEELPYDLIANVVLQTRIRHLELNLPDLSRSRSKSWPYPGANEDTCQALIQSLDEISTSLLSLHIDIGDWYPYRVDRSFRWPLGAFVIGERDYAGRMRFRKIRQFVPSGTLLREGDLVVEVPPWVTKGSWPSGLRQDMEGRISDMFCGKMVREKYANH
ncbi:hypothetical protein N7466_010551 [Penicillium verhagenii]|uniref:uncharacterized protein n=1 Tax=Penicillium verhagenii TaxID=1562060 RepID=UPI00254585E5|nr:uncharacterized protein N7466_010551 [Penicillium verhagenii]KAJ5918559.1 hypothetical protein N7466_010551 [Penicillium verhagenii]